MKKTIIFTCTFILFLVFLFPATASLGIRYVEKESQPPFSRSIKVYGENVVKENFTASKDNLTGLGISFRNFNLKNKKDINLDVYVGESKVARSVINGNIISDGGLDKFIFAPIKESKDKEITFILSAPDAKEEGSLEVFLTPNSKVSFIEYYKPASKLSLIKDIYQDWLTRFFEDRSFAIIYILIITSLSVYFFKKS